jgi:hypothetical protein
MANPYRDELENQEIIARNPTKKGGNFVIYLRSEKALQTTKIGHR